MMPRFQRLIMIFLVTLLGLLSLAGPAFASPQPLEGSLSLQSSAPRAASLPGTMDSPLLQGSKPANLTVEPLKPIVIGKHPKIIAHLTTETGKPIANQPIIVRMDGVRKAEGRTDSEGTAIITLKFKFAAGTYKVDVIYPGVPSIGLPSAIVKVDLVVDPSEISIHTVPVMPGVSFKLNDEIYTTDENGTITIPLTVSGMYAMEVLPIEGENLPANTRVEFARWNDNVFTPKREIHFPRDRRLEVGYIVSYQVDQIFYDTKGNPVDPGRVSSMVIRGIGNTYSFDGAGPIWLPANRLTRRVGERLESEEILYYFRDVVIDGANVINRSEQRFHIRPDDTWPINVLLYSAHFSARDAMFGFPIGKGIELTYPDGHTREFLFDSSQAELVIPALARGSYSARIIGAGGSAPPTPVHLSRDQNVELLMLSYLDITVIVGVPLLIALILFFVGRPFWLQVLRHPSRYKELVYQNSRRDVSV